MEANCFTAPGLCCADRPRRPGQRHRGLKRVLPPDPPRWLRISSGLPRLLAAAQIQGRPLKAAGGRVALRPPPASLSATALLSHLQQQLVGLRSGSGPNSAVLPGYLSLCCQSRRESPSPGGRRPGGDAGGLPTCLDEAVSYVTSAGLSSRPAFCAYCCHDLQNHRLGAILLLQHS